MLVKGATVHSTYISVLARGQYVSIDGLGSHWSLINVKYVCDPNYFFSSGIRAHAVILEVFISVLDRRG